MKLLMMAFSWCPWIPGTHRFDSILSLFKCVKRILLLISNGIECSKKLCDLLLAGPDVSALVSMPQIGQIYYSQKGNCK